MKKNTSSVMLIAVLWGNMLIAQSSPGSSAPRSYVGNINEMFAPAPTANNLMKFEEVPVSYYTGIPDIAIPLISIPTGNPNVKIDLQLKYHPLSAKPEDRAGETGLGWSLIAGGTISRTVRGGNPDEKNRSVLFSSPPKTKYGIYNEQYNSTAKMIRGESVNMNEFRYEAAMGKFDTEYDLYQYNFSGQSGRFYVIKDAAGNYQVEKLDKNNLKILINNDAQGIINLFTIVDDKGIRYTFEAMEKSQRTISSVKIGLITAQGDVSPSVDLADYWTAFHLTKIQDQNNSTLVTFNYGIASQVKFEETPRTTKRIASDIYYMNNTQWETGTPQNPEASMPGAIETETSYSSNQTKLLTSIEVRGRGTVYLAYEKGRQDSNYTEPSELYKLKSVQSNYPGQGIAQFTDKYIFDYGYTNTAYQPPNGQQKNLKKLLLTKVTKIPTSTGIQNQEYTLSYTTTSNILLEKDKWGYYKGSEDGFKTDVLNSITYPTKGKSVFDFGLNDYSNYYSGTGNDPVMGYTKTVSNTSSINFGKLDANVKQFFFNVITPQTVNFHYMLGALVNFNWNLTIFKKNPDGTFVPVPGLYIEHGNQTCNRPEPPTCIRNWIDDTQGGIVTDLFPIHFVETGEYWASLGGKYVPSIPADTWDTFEATTIEDIFVDEKIRLGGGLRINKIMYYDTPSSTDALKTYSYDYRNINDTLRSSGTLVFPEPVMRFSDSYSYQNKTNPSILYTANLDITTDYNIIPTDKTQGSDVGYKYVTVKQLDKNGNSKGRIVHTFRSPLDYPNEGGLVPIMPVVPIPNLDHRRGQPLSKMVYNEAGQVLSETINEYVTTEFEKNDGIKIVDNYAKSMLAEYFSYPNYQGLENHYPGIQLNVPYKSFSKFGITLPSKQKDISYFYKNGVQSSVTTITNNTYNTQDYPVSVVQSTVGGDVNQTFYQYAIEKSNQNLIAANMIGIPLETEIKKNNQTKEKTETFYGNPSNLLPSSIASYDIHTGSAIPEVLYEKYDSFGNLQQYRTKEGIPVSIIWGYNSTVPIAKIEGVAYDRITQFASSELSAFIQASDADASTAAGDPETLLLSAVDVFRAKIVSMGGQVTSYTYDSLIGVRSITQPAGIKEFYYYDSANRLKEIKQQQTDQSGNISLKTVKEFEYNYKN
ncbi:hypothetical protein [Chryseobacterium sp. Mn2064]|uniref:hypothetical protein n=1 Tax=Chryseobacterium sp. Mn2064 TaxID=3395263 RepID=UPI003BBE3607